MPSGFERYSQRRLAGRGPPRTPSAVATWTWLKGSRIGDAIPIKSKIVSKVARSNIGFRCVIMPPVGRFRPQTTGFCGLCRTQSMSGALIDGFPVAQYVGDDVVGSAVPVSHFLRRVHQDVHGARRGLKKQPDGRSPLVPWQIGVHDEEEVKVTVRRSMTGCIGAKHDDFVGRKSLRNRTDDDVDGFLRDKPASGLFSYGDRFHALSY